MASSKALYNHLYIIISEYAVNRPNTVTENAVNWWYNLRDKASKWSLERDEFVSKSDS